MPLYQHHSGSIITIDHRVAVQRVKLVLEPTLKPTTSFSKTYKMAPRGGGGRGQASAGREARSASLNSKASTRGGISKRRGGPTRTDTDGDLNMDSASSRNKPSSAANGGSSKPRPSTRSTTAGSRLASKTAQTVMRHLGKGDASTLTTRIAAGGGRASNHKSRGAGLTYLRVYGLKKSKAAANPDGGLHDLLAFLERKASAFTANGQDNRAIIIKKVCLRPLKRQGSASISTNDHYSREATSGFTRLWIESQSARS